MSFLSAPSNATRLTTSLRWPADARLVAPWFAVVAGAALLIASAPLPLAAITLLALGAGVAILARPWVGIVLLALIVPFAAVVPLPLGGIPVDGADLLLGMIVAVWLAQGVTRRSITLPRAPLTLPLLLFIGIGGLSLLAATSLREALPELAKWLQVLLLYWCVVALLPADRAGWLLAAMVAAAVGQAMIGIYQFLSQSGPDAFILFDRFMRAFGTFRQPNPYAGYLGLAAPLALSLSLWIWSTPHVQPRLRWTLRVILPAATALITAGLLLSWSRGAWLSFGAASVVVVAAHFRRAAPWMLLAAALVLLIILAIAAAGQAAGLVPAAIVDRLGNLSDYFGLVEVRHVEITDANFAVIERVAHWVAATGMWADHLWTGVGLGNYAVAYPAYALPRWQEPLGHAHNVYLNFGAEAGLLGLLAYLGLWAAAFWQAGRAALSRHTLTLAVGAGALGALVHASLHNLFDNLWVQHIVLQLSFLLGLVAVLTAQKKEAPAHG